METIFPALFRKVKGVPVPVRERLKTADGDFLDLDWWRAGNKKLLILQHGLEGSSNRPYILGMVRIFRDHGFDVLAWNFRGCSGEMNLTGRYYHSGATDDLDFVVSMALSHYSDISLLGFSLGGNLTLKYLGESPRHEAIKRAVAISVPLDLESSAGNLMTFRGYIYEKRFLNQLRKKVVDKAKNLPDVIDPTHLKLVRTLRDFDEYYTAPLHGFDGAGDYYRRCSSKFFLKDIQIPTLILNAANDPILTRESLDHDLAKDLPTVFLETTIHGGHVGFIEFNKTGYYWSEKRALSFCTEH